MPIAFYLLTGLLAATPILAIFNGSIAHHLVGLAAILLLAVAALGPDSEVAAVKPLFRRFAAAVLLPLLWMIVQIVPLPFPSLVNPIWLTTAIALNDPTLWGRISLDPGATLRSLASYLTIISIVISAAIVTRDRQRAETTLLVLCAVTTLMAVEILAGQFGPLVGMIPAAGTLAASSFAAAAALAALVNGAVIARAVERYLNRPEPATSSLRPVSFGLIAGLCGIAVSLIAMWVLAQGSLFAATGLGFAVFLFIAAGRILALRSWLAAILFTVLVVLAGVLALPRIQSGAGLTGFVTGASPATLAIAQRAISDSSWVGSGVGTFELLAKPYQDFGAQAVLTAPSTAISIVVEWGLPALPILAIFAAQLFFFIFRGGIRRGRDSFFPSVAAATVLLMLCEAFIDSSLLSIAVQIIGAVTLGLGLSQSTGRTSGSGT